jgi:hypothetical protein
MEVWKAPLQITDEQAVFLPVGAKILSVHMQQGQLCLWFLCEPNPMQERRTILVRGTGHFINPSQIKQFIGTVLMHNDNLVWHVFEGA